MLCMIGNNFAKQRLNMLLGALDERSKRLVVGAEAKVLGHGGVVHISKVAGVSRRTIYAGIEELENKEIKTNKYGSIKVRKAGGGRKKLIEKDESLSKDLLALVESTTRGDPESPLLWTCKSLRKLVDELKLLGHNVGRTTVASMLETLDYSLQGNRKTLEGSDHPDRNDQFEFINQKAKEFLASDNPVISVDTKKKELVGQYKNPGKTWRPKGKPEKVNVYDFVDEKMGRANPYGVYDIANNDGWVSVGTDHDTASFAVETIRRWWNIMGKPRYPNAKALMITADGGGSNGRRVRLWKQELQNFANEIGMPINVSHFPPGTSKWNKIEHRMFSYISMNWRGKPLVSHEVIVNLIRNTTTKTGLKIRACLDENVYPKGVKISDGDFEFINIERSEFHGEWNYIIKPNTS